MVLFLFNQSPLITANTWDRTRIRAKAKENLAGLEAEVFLIIAVIVNYGASAQKNKKAPDHAKEQEL